MSEPLKYTTLNKDSRPDKIYNELTIRSFNISEVKFGEETKIIKNVLYINKKVKEIYINDNRYIKDFDVNIIHKGKHNRPNNSIMDIIPVATKVSGNLGYGVTNLIEGVTVILTGVEENGFQPSNIGSSEGILKDSIKLGRSGTPSKEDIIINIDVILKNGHGRTREGIIASNRLCDIITQEIRESLKSISIYNRFV